VRELVKQRRGKRALKPKIHNTWMNNGDFYSGNGG
jgi:hypothetical protein